MTRYLQTWSCSPAIPVPLPASLAANDSNFAINTVLDLCTACSNVCVAFYFHCNYQLFANTICNGNAVFSVRNKLNCEILLFRRISAIAEGFLSCQTVEHGRESRGTRRPRITVLTTASSNLGVSQSHQDTPRNLCTFFSSRSSG